MLVRQTVFAIIIGVMSLGFVFEMLRRRRLREKYAVLWMLIGVLAFVVAIWPKFLTALSHAVGINTPTNLLFFGSLAVSFFIALQLSSEVGILEEETRTLAEEVGLLRLQVAELADAQRHPQHDAAHPLDPTAYGAPPHPHSGIENSGESR